MATNENEYVYRNDKGQYVVEPDAAEHAVRAITHLQKANRKAKDDIKIKEAVLVNVIQDKDETKKSLYKERKAKDNAEEEYKILESEKQLAESFHAHAVQELEKKKRRN